MRDALVWLALALGLSGTFAWPEVARGEPAHPELAALPTAPGVKPLTRQEAEKVPLLQVPAADIVRKVRATCRHQVFGIYVRGRGQDRREVERGQALFTCHLGRYKGQPVVRFGDWTLVEGRDWMHTRSAYLLTGRLPLIYRQDERMRGRRWLRREHYSFRSTPGGGEVKDERAPGRAPRRVTQFAPALTENGLTLSTLLHQGRVKPGDRFRYRWLQLKGARPIHAAVQILAVKNGQARDRSQARYKIEELVLEWGRRTTHLMDGGQRTLFMDFGDYWLRPITGPRAEQIRARLQAYRPRPRPLTFWQRHGFTILVGLVIVLALGGALTVFLVARPRRRP